MNHRTLLPLLTLFLATLLSGCGDNSTSPTVRGTGPVEAETRPLAGFDAIEIATNADVTIAQGSTPEVRLEAQRNVLDVLRTEAVGGKLRIHADGQNLRTQELTKVYITVPTLAQVALMAPGSVRSTSAWSGPSLRLEMAGAGTIDLNTGHIGTLTTALSGAGKVTLRGNAEVLVAQLSGSGELQAYDLAAHAAQVSSTGSVRGYVRVAQALDAQLSGSGSLYYRGQPAVTQRATGSGRVIDAN